MCSEIIKNVFKEKKRLFVELNANLFWTISVTVLYNFNTLQNACLVVNLCAVERLWCVIVNFIKA